jgi:hypothetical protein
MQSKAASIDDYINELPAERHEAMQKLRKLILKNLPKGFKEEMSYGMIGYVVPHDIYPKGYHCDPKLPLPFMGLASQKNFIAIYHMGVYADADLYKWFVTAHAAVSLKKLDMGKSCIRYKKTEDIPFNLIGELASKFTVANWIALYEEKYERR